MEIILYAVIKRKTSDNNNKKKYKALNKHETNPVCLSLNTS